MKFNLFILVVTLLLSSPAPVLCNNFPISDDTQDCLGCHEYSHPGIVENWQKSRHAQTTVKEAMGVAAMSRKVSAKTVPDQLSSVTVGCAECHTNNAGKHADTFEHNGYDVHVVVTPLDCATCHPTETNEFSQNLMAHSRDNLAGNTIYRQLQVSILGPPEYHESQKGFSQETADEDTQAEACYYCHGTRLEVTGYETRDTITGELTFPTIKGWPNQGVGRHNPDGSKGACSACHTRHSFSIEIARKPYTCGECHTGPDVPAYKVYTTSKHGNIYSSTADDWDFKSVPWTIGKDFSSPTCASCHISMLANTDGEVVARRTHRMSDRLSWRLFGVPYAHPHPISPDLSTILNKDNHQLAVAFDGTEASDFLIKKKEQVQRKKNIQAGCLNCHSTSWVNGHWQRFENSIQTTNTATRNATLLMTEIWNKGLATGLEQGGNPFDEAIEKKWSGIWLFYANTIRFSSAMGGGGDYSVFADGAYQLSESLQEMEGWYLLRRQLEEKK
jgi:hypothetical protein